MQDEVFGPVVTLQRFSSDDEAVAMANDVRYGLASSVFSENVGRALKVAARLDFGCVWVNEHLFPLTPEMPHGGFKESGYGKDMSMYSMEEYTRVKHVCVKLAGVVNRGRPRRPPRKRRQAFRRRRRRRRPLARDPARQFFALLGPSGCGKTTTLRMIGGFEEPTRDASSSATGRRRAPAVQARRQHRVPELRALSAHVDFDNVAFGLERKGVAKNEGVGAWRDARARRPAGRENRKPRQLSGGQQQRVALARALVNSPRVLLLDEPLGALDLKLRKQMQLELKRIQSEVGITFVHVTHDQEEAMTMADTIAVMNAGRIEQLGSPTELYERPRLPSSRTSSASSNLLQGESKGRCVRLAAGALIHVKTDGARRPVSVGVRPEKIRLGEGGVNSLRGTVRESAYIGVATQIVVATAAGEISVFHQNSETGGLVPAPGEQVTVSWSRESSFVVDRGEETIE